VGVAAAGSPSCDKRHSNSAGQTAGGDGKRKRSQGAAAGPGNARVRGLAT
jgi:hypothetical protein